jgi:hypothetical protein
MSCCRLVEKTKLLQGELVTTFTDAGCHQYQQAELPGEFGIACFMVH